jgi:hypothetical protein
MLCVTVLRQRNHFHWSSVARLHDKIGHFHTVIDRRIDKIAIDLLETEIAINQQSNLILKVCSEVTYRNIV